MYIEKDGGINAIVEKLIGSSLCYSGPGAFFIGSNPEKSASRNRQLC
jgi:hypothetical protein